MTGGKVFTMSPNMCLGCLRSIHSASPLVNKSKTTVALKGRNYCDVFRPFRPCYAWGHVTRGDALRFAPHLPLAFLFRAFGANFLDSLPELHLSSRLFAHLLI